MLVKQQDIKVGGICILSKFSKLAVIKVLGITKVGSLKYSYFKQDKETYKNNPKAYGEQHWEEDISKHNKTAYLTLGHPSRDKSYYPWQSLLYLLHRDG